MDRALLVPDLIDLGHAAPANELKNLIAGE
jgi:hypothetical protein